MPGVGSGRDTQIVTWRELASAGAVCGLLVQSLGGMGVGGGGRIRK